MSLNGGDHYLGPRAPRPQLEYDRLIGEWLAPGRRRNYAPRDELTIQNCANALQVRRRLLPSDDANRRHLPALKQAVRRLRYHYSRTPAVEFGPLALKAGATMVGAGQCRRYLNDHVDRIKRIFKWAVGGQLVPPRHYHALAAVPAARGRTQARRHSRYGPSMTPP